MSIGPPIPEIQHFQNLTLKIQGQSQMTMMLHKHRPRQFHRISNGINPSSGFRDMGSTKSGPSAVWFDKFLAYGPNGQITMTLHNYRSRQVHETLNGVNPSSSFRDMHSAKTGPTLWQIWQIFGPWATHTGQMANDHDSAQLQAQTIPHNFEWRKSVKSLQRYGFHKFGSRTPARDDNTPPARRAEG